MLQIEVNGYKFIKSIETFNESYLIPFSEFEGEAYKIDQFMFSDNYYLWDQIENKYIEVETILDMDDEDNIYNLLETYKKLKNEGLIS